MTKLFEKESDKAENGKVALEMYCHSMQKTCCDIRYKVILTDINMPVMDGITSAHKIRKLEQEFRAENPELPSVFIAAVSSFENTQTIEKCEKLGISQYLDKPVAQDQINAIMLQIFGLEPKLEAVEEQSDSDED